MDQSSDLSLLGLASPPIIKYETFKSPIKKAHLYFIGMGEIDSKMYN